MITFILAVCGNVDYVYSFPQSPPSRAAWIEISSFRTFGIRVASPPSRAAWIEIELLSDEIIDIESPPSRAAWIEIAFCQLTHTGVLESPPSRGGVDLNLVLHYRNI